MQASRRQEAALAFKRAKVAMAEPPVASMGSSTITSAPARC